MFPDWANYTIFLNDDLKLNPFWNSTNLKLHTAKKNNSNMDFAFHIQQGNQLLNKNDAKSIKKALEHFKEANEMTEDSNIGKPKTLYHLAYGNLMAGNIEQSYKIAHKAKRSIEGAIENSPIRMDNMRNVLGENEIDGLINFIDEKYSRFVTNTNTEDDDFDENELNFAHIDKLYKTVLEDEIQPQFSYGSMKEELLIQAFFGLSRGNDDLVYFDKLKGDVLSHVQGYFSSCLGDQSIANRRLANRITNNEPFDYVDESRYILFDRLNLSEFLAEYKRQAKGKEPFTSFADFYSVEVLNNYSDDNFTIEDLGIGPYIQKEFSEMFSSKYQSHLSELKSDYQNIFSNTCKSLARNWIKEKIFNGKIDHQTENSSWELNLSDIYFESSDHLRYENGIRVAGLSGGARRAIKVEDNIEGKEGYTVTVFNLDGNHPVWGTNVQVAPKQMKVVTASKDQTVLRGWGEDWKAFGDPTGSFANYGISIFHPKNEIEKIILHMHDRKVDIEYLK